MSQENVELVRRLRRVSCRRSFLRAVGGVACLGVIAVSATPAGGAFPGRNGRIAYLDTNIGGISSVRPNGSGRQRLVRRHGGVPEYSPRGDRIVFSRFFSIEPTDIPFITYFDVGRLELEARTVVGARCSPGVTTSRRHGRRTGNTLSSPEIGLVIGTTTRKAIARRGFKETRSTESWSRPRWAHAGGDPRGPEPEVVAGRQLDQLSERGQRGWDRAVRDAAAQFAESAHRQSHRWFAPSEPRLVARRQSDRAQLLDSERLRHRGDPGRRDRLAPPAPQWVSRRAHSPDGRWIVFSRPDERHCGFAQHAIWIMPARGGHPRALHDRSRHRICGSAPDWQPLP